MIINTNNLKAFYNNLDLNKEDISLDKLNSIKERAIQFNNLYNSIYFKRNRAERYIRIMELINSNCSNKYIINSKFYTSSNKEKLILFMYSVDPNFEATIIYGVENNTKSIREKITQKFGIYDPNLIKIEKFVITNFLNQKQKDEINEEIENRIFK